MGSIVVHHVVDGLLCLYAVYEDIFTTDDVIEVLKKDYGLTVSDVRENTIQLRHDDDIWFVTNIGAD